MAKARTLYRCTDCGTETPKWLGRCTKCQAWGTLEEVASAEAKPVGTKTSTAPGRVVTAARRVRDIPRNSASHSSTGIGELDRVLGGGLVKGGVILLAGEPGVGKSTLLLEVADKAAKQGRTVLLVSGEESAEQIKLRADRVGADAEDLFIASEHDLSVVIGHIEDVQPDLVIVDSVQAIASPDVEGRMGGVAQVTEVATVMTKVAKERGIPTILIGQVTKDGNIAGPRIVEHLVDVVLHFEGDKHSTLRMLRGVKNRYGPSDEVGCFEHTEGGIVEVPDPSGLFLGDREEPVPGVCVTVTIEGKRPIPAEIQALVAPSPIPVPRRGCSGLDSARLNMVQAVVERHGRVRTGDKDVYAATVGGMKIVEPSADLALALALASAAYDVPMRADVVALGEVALSGDIRKVAGIERRLAEASRLGFKVALVPVGTREALGDRHTIRLVELGHIRMAIQAMTELQAPNAAASEQAPAA